MCGNINGMDIADPLDFSGRRKRRDAQEATARMDKTEADRQGRISSNVAGINKAYGGRESQYGDFVNALREQYASQLGRMRDNAARQSKFSLARGGLTGSSVAVDTGRTLNREAQEGVLNAERQVQGQAADLRGRDEASRLSMISLAQSGNDIGNAAMQTSNALRANIEGAKNVNVAEGLGDAFGDTAALYRKQQDAAARRKGLKEASVYANPFTRGGT